MNENPDQTNTENPEFGVNSENDATLEHSSQTFQPVTDSLETDVDFTRASAEMPDIEVEPPTMGDHDAETDVASAKPETFSDEMLDEPRDEVDLSSFGTSGAETQSNGSNTESLTTDGRVPFHANEIHETVQPSFGAAPEPMPELKSESDPETIAETSMPGFVSESSASEQEANALYTEPPTEAPVSSFNFSEDPTTFAPLTPLAEEPVKKRGVWNKKRTVLSAGLAVILVLIIGGGALAYKGWYQAPSKVLSDATMNFMRAKSMTYSGTMGMGESGSQVNISFNGGMSGDVVNSHIDAAIKSGTTNIEVPVDIVAQNSTVYFKLSNLKKLESQLLSPYIALMGGSSQAQVDSLVKSIDGTWYKVTPSDLNETAQDKQKNTCINNVIDKIRTDRGTQTEIMDVYKNHPLFTLKKELGSKNGSLGYELQPVSDAKANEFAKAFEDTSVYKSLVKCDSSIASLFDTTSSTDTTPSKDTMQVWVGRWDHQLTKITMTSNDSATPLTMTFVPKVGDETSITIPSNAKSIDDLKKQFTDFEQSMEMQSMQASASAEAEMNSANSLHDAQMKQMQEAQQSSNVQAIVQ